MRPARLASAVLILIVTAALLTAPGPGRAAGPLPDPTAQAGRPPSPEPGAGGAGDDMAARLAGIEAALDRIALLLADALDQQLVNVLMRRIELKERSLEPLQQALRDARGERDSLAQEQKRLKDIVEMMARPEPGEPAEESEGLRKELGHARRELERMAERTALLDQRIVEMESDLDRQRDDIRALEQMVDERIGLR